MSVPKLEPGVDFTPFVAEVCEQDRISKQDVISGLKTGKYLTEPLVGRKEKSYLIFSKVIELDGKDTSFVQCSRCGTVITTRGNQLGRHARKTCPKLKLAPKIDESPAPLPDYLTNFANEILPGLGKTIQEDQLSSPVAEYLIGTGLPVTHCQTEAFRKLLNNISTLKSQSPSFLDVPDFSSIQTACNGISRALFQKYGQMVATSAEAGKVTLEVHRINTGNERGRNEIDYIVVLARFIVEEEDVWRYKGVPLVLAPYYGNISSESVFQIIVHEASKLGLAEQLIKKCKLIGKGEDWIKEIGEKMIAGYTSCGPHALYTIAGSIINPRLLFKEESQSEKYFAELMDRLTNTCTRIILCIRSNSELAEKLGVVPKCPDPKDWLSVLDAIDCAVSCLPMLVTLTELLSVDITMSTNWLAATREEAQFLLKAMNPMKTYAIEFNSPDKVMLPFIAPTYYVLLDHFKKLQDGDDHFEIARVLGKVGMLATQEQIENLTIDHYCASFLNPSTRKMKLYTAEIKQKVTDHITKELSASPWQLFKELLLPPPPKKCFYADDTEEDSGDEIIKYLAEPNSLQLSIEEFWPTMKMKTPALYEYAMQLLAIPADDTSFKRIINTIEHMLTDEGNNNSDVNIERLIMAKLLSDLEPFSQ